MSESNMSRKRLKPILILTVAAIILSKIQRALTEENSAIESSNINDPPVCPDYCNLPADRATRGKAPFLRWYYDPSEGSCQRFRWGGRGGNKNRFRKKADCEETCSKCTFSELMKDESSGEIQKSDSMQNIICSPLLDEGHCDQATLDQSPKTPQLMWHYNKENAKCSPFVFFGCGGNSNKFANQKDCEDTCH